MIRILLIVPYPELEEKVSLVLSHHAERDELDVTVRVLTVEEAPVSVEKQYDAVIARGYTARKMSDLNPQIPVIPLTISGFDIVRAMRECVEQGKPKKIAVIGYTQNFFEVKDLAEIFGVKVEAHSAIRHDNLSQIIAEAKKNGCDALIGGYSACLLGRSRGMLSVVIRTGESAVEQAIDEAVHTVRRVRMERMLAQLYKTILYSSTEGVVFVDRDGVIRLRNRLAGEMNGGRSLIDRHVKEELPYLNEKWESVMHSQRREVIQLVTIPGTKIKASVFCQPVFLDREIRGVVFTISDITQIQNLEGQIRRKLSERGWNAKYDFSDIVHESAEIDALIDTARRYAYSDSNVIIVGETGTGKELFAQSIHRHSRRKKGPFVVINCAALPENLLESELFGYSEGAFTGASRGGKRGLFEQAHGGTLFLDELEEIPMATQTKLLRVLQEKQVRRIGDNKIIDVDVRIISATNKSIQKMCDRGEFRQDLMYRLDVLRLFVPPLRRRGHDIEVIFAHLLREECLAQGTAVPEITRAAAECLSRNPFYGNVRELKNLVERICALRTGETVNEAAMRRAMYPEDLEQDGFRGEKAAENVGGTAAFGAEEAEKIREALRRCGNRKQEAARELGMDRSTLWRKMRKYSIQ